MNAKDQRHTMTRFVSQDDSAITRRKGKSKEREVKQEPNLLFFSDYECGNLHRVKPLNDGIEYSLSTMNELRSERFFFFGKEIV